MPGIAGVFNLERPPGFAQGERFAQFRVFDLFRTSDQKRLPVDAEEKVVVPADAVYLLLTVFSGTFRKIHADQFMKTVRCHGFQNKPESAEGLKIPAQMYAPVQQIFHCSFLKLLSVIFRMII